MKITKSSINRIESINTLPKGKVRITISGEHAENIWVAIDEDNKVMYLLNDAIMFYPILSWGMELPLTTDSVDMLPYRGYTFEDTAFTLCSEAYEALSDYLDDEGNFDVDKYLDSKS